MRVATDQLTPDLPELVSFLAQLDRRFPLCGLRGEVALEGDIELGDGGLYVDLIVRPASSAAQVSPRSARVCLIPSGWIGDITGNIAYLESWIEVLGELVTAGVDLSAAAPAELVCPEVLELSGELGGDLSAALRLPCWLGRLRTGGRWRLGPVELLHLLSAALPVRGEISELMLAAPYGGQPSVEETASADLRATLQLISWDVSEGQRQIRDVKEQQLWLVPAGARDDGDRVKAYLLGWAAALRTLFVDLDVSELMPHDLACPDVLTLRRATTAADYQAALLRPSRLGRLLRKRMAP